MPGVLDGAHAATITTLLVQLEMGVADDGNPCRANLRSVRTGATATSFGMPALSRTDTEKASRAPGGAMLVPIEFEYDASGRAGNVVRVAGLPKQSREMMRAVPPILGQWAFELESVGGRDVPGKIIVPICITAADSKSSKSAMARCRWTHSSGTITLEERQSLAIGSVVDRKTDVVRTEL